jgi:hypothetical protein
MIMHFSAKVAVAGNQTICPEPVLIGLTVLAEVGKAWMPEPTALVTHHLYSLD